MQSKVLHSDTEKEFNSYDLDRYLKSKRPYLIIKRVLDFIFSLLGLAALIPVFLLTAAAVKLDSKGPVFFKQKRIGKNGGVFTIYKFRTMSHTAKEPNMYITKGSDSRITGVGKFLRKFKIDEIPQLINVLKGDMSFVGPRPEVPKYVRLYDSFQRRVLAVKPGITDYASIKYRNEGRILDESLDPESLYVNSVLPDKISLNLRYIESMSLLTDIKLILCTLLSIIKAN